MAITIGVATATSNTTAPGRAGNGDLTIPLPASWAAGQVAVILLYSDQGSGSTPSGWNQLTGSPFGAGTQKLQVFWRVLETGDTYPVTTISGSSGTLSHCAGIVTFNGVDFGTAVEAIGAASNGTGTPMTAGAVNTVTDGAWAVGGCGRGDNESASGQTFGGSATGVTERLDAGTSQGDDSQVSMYTKEIATGGTSTGAGSATTSATDPWVSLIFVLKAAVNVNLRTDLMGFSFAPATQTNVLLNVISNA